MQMTEKEICDSYKYAIDQKKQVKILAELNATGRQQIVDILEANGFKVDKRVCNEGRPVEPAQSTMSEAAKKAAREYKREWNRANKDKVRESNARYCEKKASLGEAAEFKPQTAVLMPKEPDNLAELITSLRGTGAKLTIEVTL